MFTGFEVQFHTLDLFRSHNLTTLDSKIKSHAVINLFAMKSMNASN